MIQRHCLEQLGYSGVIQQEYDKITKIEEVTKIAQTTINNLCDYNRKIIISKSDNYLGDVNVVNYIASTKITLSCREQIKISPMCIYSTEE